ncbi:hypothetical protein [Actinomadura sp. 9N215]|uniref:VMAP-C domain-containing protein n=1 Tax=Actinomadura sp. 9N215 TaxID=3375150 RepID=UPI0037B12D77
MSPATQDRGGVHGARGADTHTLDTHALTSALAKVRVMHQHAFRLELVEEIGRELGEPLSSEDSQNARIHISAIVRACADRTGGIAALAKWLPVLAGEDDSDVIRFRGLASPAGPLVGPEDETRLRDALAQCSVPEVPRLFSAAADGMVGMLDIPWNAWDAFVRLADTNVRSDDVPPHLVFVGKLANLLARARDDASAQACAATLRAWVTEQIGAYRARGDRELADRIRRLCAPAAAPAGTGLPMTLIVMLEQDLRGRGDRYVVTRWRQLDPVQWRPERDADELAVRRDEIPGTVASLLRAAERDWAGRFGGSLGLELILPNELLNLDADQWPSDEDDALAVPIGAEYEVILRSQQRLRERAWHRHWIVRSRALGSPALAGGANHELHRCPPELEGDASRLRLHLNSQETVVAYLLSSPPDREPGRSELPAALRVGVPVVLWSRDPEVMADLWDAMTSEPLHALPDRVKSIRRDAAINRDAARRYGRHISLIWDSYDRFIGLAEPFVSTAL